MEITSDACLFHVPKRKMLFTLEMRVVLLHHYIHFKCLFLCSTVQYAAFIDSNKVCV